MSTESVIEIKKKRLVTHRKPIKQEQALLRPKAKTVEAKYLSTPLKGQEKPRYFLVI